MNISYVIYAAVMNWLIKRRLKTIAKNKTAYEEKVAEIEALSKRDGKNHSGIGNNVAVKIKQKKDAQMKLAPGQIEVKGLYSEESDQEARSDRQHTPVDAENSGNIILTKPKLYVLKKSSNQELSVVSEDWEDDQGGINDQQVSGKVDKSANIDDMAAEFDEIVGPVPRVND